MSRSFTFACEEEPAVLLARARAAAARVGADLDGDDRGGTFTGMGVVGHYRVDGRRLTVTVTEKPEIMSWDLVARTLSGFFGVQASPADDAAPADDPVDTAGLRRQADAVIRSHVLWSLGAGLIPLPMLDLAAVTAVQVGMLEQLAKLYGVSYHQSSGKTFVTALAGTTLARVGASLLKVLPGFGTVAGGASMSVLSGASTYGVGQVAVDHFARKQPLGAVDMASARSTYRSAFEQGKAYVSDLKADEGTSRDVFEKLRHLGELRDRGILSDVEFAAKKEELLARL